MLVARQSGLCGCRVGDTWVTGGYYLVILRGVKTAISVPDETFEQASAQAAELGISRSEFFARAARRYLDELASDSLTSQIDQALQVAGDDDSAAAAAASGRARIGSGDDW